jgi:hypothetical protein
MASRTIPADGGVGEVVEQLSQMLDAGRKDDALAAVRMMLEAVVRENEQQRQKIAELLRRVYGPSGETLDPRRKPPVNPIWKATRSHGGRRDPSSSWVHAPASADQFGGSSSSSLLWGHPSAIRCSTSRKYAQGSTPASEHVPSSVYMIAARRPPSSLPTKR